MSRSIDRVEELSFTEAKDLLKEWRDRQIRASEDVIVMWEKQLQPNFKHLGSDVFAILEQVFTAALDVGYFKLAEKHLKLLSKQFPNSLKVACLKSMYFQAREKYKEALNLIDVILVKDPNDTMSKKRKVSILKDMGKMSEAIKELVEFLKLNPFDFEAWQELADYYLTENELQKAAHCVETLILHFPNDHLWLQKFADIKYTQGGFENYELSRIYYLYSLKICKNNLRALLGLNLVCNNLLNSPKMSSAKKKLLTKYISWSSDRIRAINENSDNNDELNNLMHSLEI